MGYVKVREGEKIKDYELTDMSGKSTKLSKHIKDYLVIYFYPKDDTPGCTVEAKEFSQHLEKFHEAKAEVIGISNDDEASHKKFCDKYNLKVKLLSDKQKVMTRELGILGEKSFMGKKYEGITRTTILVDKNLTVLKVWENVKPENHAKQVLEHINSINK
ncbi:MAG: peroxiredoxin [Candidatus Micrarchaeota archaeon]|nr:peroxiredoxin [Candidatus Micrarchaeota archaeon]